MNLRDYLVGCTAYPQIQTVGIMTMVPLIADKKYQDDSFASPLKLLVSTSSYGKLVFNNPEGKAMIVPAHAAYMTKHRSQDHAMMTAGVVGGKAQKTYSNAACIESSQGGYMPSGEKVLNILPWSLREYSTSKRGNNEYGKIWSQIGQFNKSVGISSGNQHLTDFFDKFKEEMDQFVAQFETVPGQVGAIILINGNIFGVERTPNETYFKEVFEALIRGCYGSLVIQIQKGLNPAKAKEFESHIALKDSHVDLADLRQDLIRVRAEEAVLAKSIINGIIDEDLTVQLDTEKDEISAKTVGNSQMSGQVVLNGKNPVYTSAVVKKAWLKSQKWFNAPEFDM